MAAAKRKPISLGGRCRVPALPPGSIDAMPERLRHALAEGDVGEQRGARRLADPLDTLAARQSLDRDNKGRNDALWQAGLRLRHHWHRGQLHGLKAYDMGREVVDGGLGAQAMTPTEAALRDRMIYHRAMAAVGDRLRPYVTAVVLDGIPAVRLCHLVTESGHARTQEAIVVERLRESLDRLAEHWGLLGRARQLPSDR